MSSHFNPSQVRFTDEETLAMMSDALITDERDLPAKSHLVAAMFDRQRLQIGHTLGVKYLPSLEEMNDADLVTLFDGVERSIADVVALLLKTFDLSSKEWKNAPAIWELLSFDPQVLYSAKTELPKAILNAVDSHRSSLEGRVDVEEFTNDLDEVIHQTAARRTVIEHALRAATDTEISTTPLLHVDSIRSRIFNGISGDAQHEQAATNQILAEAAAMAICHACHPKEASPDEPFALQADQVERVTPETAMFSAIGDVYLVRSQNVQSKGDHFIVIIGGLIQKPHGVRPADMSFPVPEGMATPLGSYPAEEPLVLLKLDDASRIAFYRAFDVPQEFRRI